MSGSDETPVVLRICDKHENRPDCLIEILHQVQKTLGFLSEDDLKSIAEALNISRAEIHGVVSFYHDFRRQPAGKKVVKICLAEACQAVGCESLKAHAEESLSVTMGGTTADGGITLKPVYCLGNCALGPAMLIDDTLHGRVTKDRFEALMAEAQS